MAETKLANPGLHWTRLRYAEPVAQNDGDNAPKLADIPVLGEVPVLGELFVIRSNSTPQ